LTQKDIFLVVSKVVDELLTKTMCKLCSAWNF